MPSRRYAGLKLSGDTPSTLRILVVEDHDETREMVSHLLDHFGFEIASAASVAAASQLFERDEFDVLLIDIGLPDGNGYDLAIEAKRRRPVKIIAITGRSEEDPHKKAVFDFYLTKPVDFAELRTVLGQIAVECS